MDHSKNEADRIKSFNSAIIERNPAEHEFHQAVQEFTGSVMPFVMANAKYDDGHILQRITEPDRIVIFRVCWEDDNGHIHRNRAWFD